MLASDTGPYRSGFLFHVGPIMEEGTEKERGPNDFKGTEIAAAVVISVVATCH